MGKNNNKKVDDPSILFEHNSPELASILHKHGIKKTYSDKKTIVSPGDWLKYFYFIDEGIVKYKVTSIGGTDKVFMILGKGSFFGEGPIISKEPSRIFAIAEPKTTLYELPKEKFEQLLVSSVVFNNIILKSAYKKITALMFEIESISLYSCKERLWNFLWALTEDSNKGSEWLPLKCRFTQHEIATIIGASRVTVTKLLSELRDEGLIRMINRDIEVKKFTKIDGST